jgi:aldehyde:ferredoxin oxidoreductase
VQQRREMDECISAMRSLASACASSIGFTEEWVLRAFVKNANVTSVSPRRGNAWNLYQAYSHSDEHEKAEYARALRVNEDLEDGEEPSTQQWQLTYDDFYLEFGEENADEILVTFGQLRHLGAQTHAQ